MLSFFSNIKQSTSHNGVTVAHICRSYLPLSETFIYRYLINFTSISPIVLAEQVENVNFFPPNCRVYDCSYKKYSSRWFVDCWGRKVLGVDNLFKKRVLKSHTTKIIHAHFGPSGYEMLELKKWLNIPLITTFYGYDMSELPNIPTWKIKFDKLFQEGDLFLVEGHHMKKSLINLGCPESKIRIQHIAIDTNQFAYRERIPKKNKEVILLFCGRFIEKKGLIYALKAFKHILPQFPNIRFRLIGDGELRSEIENFIKTNSLATKIDLLGFQPHHVVEREMADADIFIHPSITSQTGDTEGGAPTILLECQAAGVPVLATYHADIPEVVIDKKSALLSEEKDWRKLADNLLFFLKNQDCWSDFGKVGRKHVVDSYNITKEVLKLESIYSEFAQRVDRTTINGGD